jgi:hypothetical protein
VLRPRVARPVRGGEPGRTQHRELEKPILSRKLVHGDDPVARWMAANVAVAQDPAGNLKPAKYKSTKRIDGIVALIMALAAPCSPRRSRSPSTPCSLCDLLDGSM